MYSKRLTSLTLASMLLLTGCTSGKTVNNKSVAASLSNGNVYADTVYSRLSNTTNGRSSLFSYVLDQLLDEKFPVTSDMEENADNMVDSIKSSYKNQYGEDKYLSQLNTDLKSSGYTSVSNYREKVIYSLQYAEMMKKYVKANFDEVFEDYYKMATPRKLSLIKISVTSTSSPTKTEKAKLKEVKDLLKEGKSFSSVAKSYSDDSDSKEAGGSLGVVDTTSSLSDTYGSEVSSAALSLEEGKTSDTITGTDGYYILHCDSTSKKDIKKEVKTIDINSPLLTYDNYMVYLAFKTYKVNYNDKTIKAAMDKVINENLKARKEERA